MKYQNRTMILLILVWIGYLLPWIHGHSAGLTMGAYDLAEWMSIHPANRATSPPLVWSMLLRLPPVLLACGTALIAADCGWWRWWIAVSFVLFLGLYSLPPLESLSEVQTDNNVFQQASLSIAAITIGSGFLLWQRSHSIRYWFVIVILGLCLVAPGIGLIRVVRFVDDLGMQRTIGLGVVFFTMSLIALVLDFHTHQMKKSES